jgi:hypothetical protein
MIAAPLASADGSENEIYLSPSPQVTINVSNVVSVNVTYSDVFIATSSGVFGAQLGDLQWKILNGSQGYSYVSNFTLYGINGTDLSDLYLTVMNLGDNANLGGGKLEPISAQAYVNVSRYDGQISNLNLTSGLTQKSFDFSGINNSTVKLSLSITVDLTAGNAGNETFVIVQRAAGAEDSKQFYYNEVNAYSGSSMYGGGLTMGNNSTDINSTRALYWWNYNYTHNGVAGTDTISIIPREEGVLLAFVLNFQAHAGSLTVTQDPYVSVLGADLSNSRLLLYGTSVINYVADHAVFLGIGMLAGAAAVGMMYRGYRKKKPRN